MEKRSFNKTDKFKRSPRRDNIPMMRSNRYQLPEGADINYKNFALLQKFITDRGKIVSRRISGISAKNQRALTAAIKRAKYLGLLITGVKRK